MTKLKKIFHEWRTHSSVIFELFYPFRFQYGAGMVFLVFVDILDLAPAVLMKYAVDAFEKPDSLKILLKLSLWLIAISVAQGILRFGWRHFVILTGQKVAADVRRRFYEQLQRLGPGYYQKNLVGDLISRGTSDVEAIKMGMSTGFLLLFDSLMYIAIVPFLLIWLDPITALVTCVPLIVLPFLIFRIEKKIHLLHEDVQTKQSDLAATLQEQFQGIRVLKSFGVENLVRKIFLRDVTSLKDTSIKFARSESLFHPTIESVAVICMLSLILFGGVKVIAGAITVGSFVALQRLAQKLLWPMANLGWSAVHLQRAATSYRRIRQVIDTPSDQPGVSHVTDSGPDLLPHSLSSIDIKDMWFRFSDDGPWIFKGLNLEIKIGERVAILGPVAAGKSVLFNILNRFHHPAPGSVYIHGHDICTWDVAELRKNIGYVPQDVFLFSRTIRKNLELGGGTSGDELYWKAVNHAAIAEEIMAFPDGMETIVGERGVTLSGGQRQRLGIARVFIEKKPILLFDDCFSAVDTETESRILQGIKGVAHDQTMIFATHRLSILETVDRVVLLESGEIAASGTHRALLGTHRRYTDFVQKHQNKEVNREPVKDLGGVYRE